MFSLWPYLKLCHKEVIFFIVFTVMPALTLDGFLGIVLFRLPNNTNRLAVVKVLSKLTVYAFSSLICPHFLKLNSN